MATPEQAASLAAATPTYMDQAAADRITAATNAAPGLPLEASVPIGQASQDGSSAIINAQAAAGLTDIQNLAQALSAQSTSVQLGQWKNMTAERQNQLKAVGYNPPHPHSGGIGGLLHRVVSDVINPLGSAFGGTANFTLHDVVNPVLQVSGASLREVQRGWRTYEQVYSDVNPKSAQAKSAQGVGGGLNLHRGTNWGMVFSPGEWARAWDKVNNGEKTFLPVVRNGVIQKYGPDTEALAEKMAGGAKPQDLILQVPPSQRQAFQQRLATDQDLRQAVTELQAGKMSVGRAVVGQNLIVKHPALGHAISGGIDAVYDWYGDPLTLGLGALSDARTARYLVTTPADVQRLYETRPAVQRGFQELANRVKSGSWTSIADYNPKLAPIATDLIAKGADTPEKLVEYFKGPVGMAALLSGKAAKVGGEAGGTIPRLTRAGEARLAAKGALQHSIDFLADTPARLQGLTANDVIDSTQELGGKPVERVITHPLASMETGAGKLARRLLTIAPPAKPFDASSDRAVSTFRNIALMTLPRARADQLTDVFAKGDTLGEKRKLFIGMTDEMLTAGGWEDSPELAAQKKAFLDQLNEGLTQRMYAPSGIDKIMLNGESVNAGLWEQHMTEEWQMPQFREVWGQAKKLSMARTVMGPINSNLIDTFMQSLWKPAELMRMGFPVRAGGDELMAFIMREGPLAYAKSFLARSSQKTGPIMPVHPIGAIWHQAVGHLPGKVQDSIKDAKDFAVMPLADRYRRAFRNVEGKLSGQATVNYYREMADRGYLTDAQGRYLSAVHSRAGGFLDEPTSHTKLLKDGRVRSLAIAPSGAYKQYDAGEQFYHDVWAKNLNEIATSGWGRAALESQGAPMQERIQNVVDAIDANPKAWDLSVRSTQTTDGRSLLSGEVTDQQTKTDAAMQMIKAADAATMSPHGLPIEVQPDVTLAQHLLKNRRAPTVPALSQIDAASLPEHVKGPEMIQVAHNALRELVERGFNNIGRFMDWLIREPMYLHNYAESREIPGFAQSLYQSADESGRQNLDELVQDLAHERAFEKTLPFIHDPQVRSQAATVMRNLIPFYFAQEQFFKRWARTFAFSPESFRKAQLAINGMRHMGIIHKDQQTGQEYFLYPAAGATQDVLIRAYEAVTGHKASLPIPANLRGEIQFLSPGTERLGLPSFGPMVAMPLDALSSRFPELEQAKQSILGQRGANPSRWEQIVPSTMSRLVHYAIDKPDTSAQLNSAMNQAIQYLDATGHGLPENASTEQLHQFLSRVENWARVLFLTRMVFGFNVPASPELQIDPSTLHEDYAQLLKELPYNKATQTFLGQHPDATAFTVFQSKSQSGAPLPATAAAESFLQSHMSFLKDYPMAGAWFIPQQDSKGQYDQAAYRIQLAEQLRTRKDPTTFYKDVVYAKDATAYFQAEDRKNTALRGAHGAEATAIRQTWSAESQAYLKAHPIFAEMLQSSDAKFQRTQALQQLTLALNDSRLPKSPQTDHIRTLIDGYNTYQAMYSQFHGLRTAAASHARRQLEVEFASEITQYVQENPDVEGIYNRVIRPDITTAISAMEAVTGVPAPVGI